MSIDLTTISLALVEKYGLIVVFVYMVYHYLRGIDERLDDLINLNHKTFGIILTLVDKKQRTKYTKEKDGGEDGND